jgi:hypothetical protein
MQLIFVVIFFKKKEKKRKMWAFYPKDFAFQTITQGFYTQGSKNKKQSVY